MVESPRKSIRFGSSPVDRAGDDHSHSLSRSQPGLNAGQNKCPRVSRSRSGMHTCQHIRATKSLLI